jgi:hypothetical protein
MATQEKKRNNGILFQCTLTYTQIGSEYVSGSNEKLLAQVSDLLWTQHEQTQHTFDELLGMTAHHLLYYTSHRTSRNRIIRETMLLLQPISHFLAYLIHANDVGQQRQSLDLSCHEIDKYFLVE